jgi:hypothetical protein
MRFLTVYLYDYDSSDAAAGSTVNTAGNGDTVNAAGDTAAGAKSGPAAGKASQRRPRLTARKRPPATKTTTVDLPPVPVSMRCV